MPTLFRMVSLLGIIVLIGYGCLYAMATFLVPGQRDIVQVVSLPQTAQLTTGRSAAERLTGEAELLVKKHHRGERRR